MHLSPTLDGSLVVQRFKRDNSNYAIMEDIKPSEETPSDGVTLASLIDSDEERMAQFSRMLYTTQNE